MIRRRRHAKEQFAGRADSATHRIKMGTTQRKKSRDGKDFDMPTPTNGFYIVRDNFIKGGGLELDMVSMSRLGFGDQRAVESAIAEGRDASVGGLPTQLDFVILSDARRNDDGEWEFPGIIEEEYQAWNTKGIVDAEWKAANVFQCSGLFCHGDGNTAQRRLPDGTRKTVECVPFGSAGADAKSFCPYSTASKSPCRAKVQLVVALAIRGEDGRLRPLADSHAARFRFETTSENNAMRIIDELVRAADMLDGNLANIEGTLTFSLQKKIKPAGTPGEVGLTPQVAFALNKWQIGQRAQSVRDGRLIAAGSATRLIEGTTPNHAPAPKQLMFDDRAGGTTQAESLPDVQVGDDGDPFYSEQREIEDSVSEERGPELAPPVSDSRPIKTVEATDEEIFDALASFARTVNRETGQIEADICAAFMSFEYQDKGEAKEYRPARVDWFMAESGPKGEYRRGKMREVSERMERQCDPRFLIYRDAEATTN